MSDTPDAGRHQTCHTLNGKPLNECSLDDLSREWNAGMCLDAAQELTDDEAARLRALDKAIGDKRYLYRQN